MGVSRTMSQTSAAKDAGLFGNLGAPDFVLLLTSLALSAAGIFGVYVAGERYGQFYATNQAYGFGAGLVGAVALALIDYRTLKKYLPIVYGLAVVMLLAVTLTGISAKGAQRWIDIGPVQIQPSEFAKLLMVVVLAGFLADRRVSDPRVFVKAMGILALPALLVFAQPDLGTTLVFAAVFFVVTFVGGARLYQLGLLVAAGAAVFALAVKLRVLQDYQIARLTAFIDPEGDPNVAYQVAQSKISVGSGGLTGKGLDATTLANLGFLPEDHTDFIFSNLAERIGFVGCILLLALFFVLVWRMLRVATIARDRFGVLIAVGVATIFLFHVFVNVGMTLGMMPVTGIPLPFISYGRSSLVMSIMATGLIQGIVMRSKKETSKYAV